MDCCICGAMASVYRLPRNTICESCYTGARSMISLVNGFQGHGFINSSTTPKNGQWLSGQCKDMLDVRDWIFDMKRLEEKLNNKLEFLGSFEVAFSDEIHTDILIKPGTGLPIPAHRAILATKSVIFRTMLDYDECKAPAGDTISLPEFSHEELACFLEFLYRGDLEESTARKHAFSLLVAADKYNIPFLRTFSEKRIKKILTPSNALDVLEISEVCSSRYLKDKAMRSIVEHAEDVVFSGKYAAFVMKNAHLSVEITRALLKEMEKKVLLMTKTTNNEEEEEEEQHLDQQPAIIDV